MTSSIATTFTFTCDWGCTVRVEDGKEQPHKCLGTSALVDALRVTDQQGKTVLEVAERLAFLLRPDLRELRNESWKTGVRDGRSGVLFYGIDNDAIAAEQAAIREEKA